MKHKRYTKQLLALFLMLTMVLSGCNNKPQTTDMTQTVADLATAGITWYLDQEDLSQYQSGRSDELVFLLAQANALDDTAKEAYLTGLNEAMKYGIEFEMVSQWQRMAFAIAACGSSPTDATGLDFLAMVQNYDVTDQNNYVDLYVLNSKLLTIGAFDLAAADIDDVLQAMLAMQNEEGAFVDQWGTTIDSTALALQSLAMVSDRSDAVQEAIDKGVNYLSIQQGNDGALSFAEEANLASTAQTCVALTVLGIDPHQDDRFIKDGHSLVDALTVLYQQELDQEHKDDYNMSQGLMGLVSYGRFAAEETGYYAPHMFTSVTDSALAPTETTSPNATDQPLVNKGDTASAPTDIKAEAQTQEAAETVTVSIAGDEGNIVAPSAVAWEEGDTAYSVLKRLAKEESIAIEVSGSGGKVYVQGIADLYEFDKGATSGWLYEVNGEYPQKGAGSYTVAAGDVINWVYTLEMGQNAGESVK